MALASRHAPLALLAALVVVSAGLSSGADTSVSAAATASGAKARIGLATARKISPANRCAARISRARARRMTPAQRKRVLTKMRMRNSRSCRPQAARSTVPGGPIYWGAWISKQLTGGEAPWDMSAVDAFEGMAQKRLSVIQFASPFADCSRQPCSFYDFPTRPLENIRKHGAIPLLGWTSQSTPSSLNQPNFQLSDVISGTHDAYIREFAEAARDWGHPFFLRFNWEMNGNWFSWSEGVNGNQKGEYVAAWRHVHDIFREVGATNVTWVWCPNVDPFEEMQDLASLYPGDQYVDWTGLDGYNWGTHPTRRDKWRSFDQLFRRTYELIAESIAPSKPMIVSEVGSTEHGGSKAAWIEDMLRTVPAYYPKIRGLLWFEKFDDDMDWPLETSTSSVSAFASGIQNPIFVDNRYGELGASPIPPPS